MIIHSKVFCQGFSLLSVWLRDFWHKEIGTKAAFRMLVKLTAVSISPTFYKQHLHQNPYAKKSQSLTVIREKLRKALLYEKVESKILMKLRPGYKTSSIVIMSGQMFQRRPSFLKKGLVTTNCALGAL